MPELPEVEHLRRTLEPLVLGRRVVRVRVLRRDVISTPNDPIGGFSKSRDHSITPSKLSSKQLLANDTVIAVDRKGKQLAIRTDSQRVILVHLGMTGRLGMLARRAPLEPHTHVVWSLDDGNRIVFVDPRRFGGIWTLENRDQLIERHWSRLGPDGLTITASQLSRALLKTARPLKAALLDQSLIAGLGNIYADEVCFRAQCSPNAHANQLQPAKIRSLSTEIRTLLAEAVDRGGSTLRDYRDANGQSGRAVTLHQVYGRSGFPCVRCGQTLVKGIQAGRTTVWCERCQR